MTLKTCLEIAQSCELNTVGEAIYNIELHSTNLFSYDEMDGEFDELYGEYDEFSLSKNITKETSIDDALDLLMP